MSNWFLSPDRCFDPDPAQRSLAQALYATVRDLPLICPHGHVDPALLADPAAGFGTPADLFIIPDHYVVRMLYSQGARMEDLGIPTLDGTPVETDHRRIWLRFAERFDLFRGTPTGLWLADELINAFGVTEKLNGGSAMAIYEHIEAQLNKPEFSPRALFRRFGIRTLCTTDPAGSDLRHHAALREAGWGDKVRPTFRPDAVVNLRTAGWHAHVRALGAAAGIAIESYATFVRALEQRRAFFKSMGATATDHAAETAFTERLSAAECEATFARALRGEADADDAARFTGHMLIEMARMSAEDGLVMQLHIGSLRNHNELVFRRFGSDRGADMPLAGEFTRGLRPLLNAFGNDPRFKLILFTLDESVYSRELAPLAGHYPAVKLGPPWWFHDSVNGMRRFLDLVTETAGLANLAGFNDDTRAFCSIPSRHDVWRRVSCDWLASLALRGLIDEDDARAMALDLATGLAERAYKLG